MECQTVEKRLLSELFTLYEYEPDLRDIYVEGASDRILINGFIGYNIDNISIIEINDIDFSELYETNPSIKSNCKKKIIELSKQLENNFSNCLKNVMCIVDRDYDDFFNLIRNNFYLYYTDFASIEIYFFNNSSIRIFFQEILFGFPYTSDYTISQLKPVLNELYNIKLALLSEFGLDFEINKFDFKNLINIDKSNGKISFDAKDYIYRFLNANKLMKNKCSVENKYNELAGNTISNMDLRIRGHDFTYLFYLYFNKIKNPTKINFETFERILFRCIDINTIKNTELFRAINQKY